MRLKLTLLRSESDDDVLVTLDAAATVGDLASALALMSPPDSARPPAADPDNATIRSHGFVDAARGAEAVVLDPHLPVLESGLRSGAQVSIADSQRSYDTGGASRGRAAALLRVMSGPDAGREFPLYDGTNYLGREQGNDVVLSDPLVSKRHARISVAASIDIVDLESANGVVVDGVQVQRTTLSADNAVLLGDTELTVLPVRKLTGGADSSVDFNRQPLVRAIFADQDHRAPDLPDLPRPFRMPYLALLAPLLMGGIFYAVTKSVESVVFIGLSPLLMIGSYLDQARETKRETKQDIAFFEEDLQLLRTRVTELQVVEKAARLAESPSTAEAADAAERLGSTLWLRRPDVPGFMTVRLGIGTMPSRVRIVLPDQKRSMPGFWEKLLATHEDLRDIDDVPVVADFFQAGGVGVAGPTGTSTPLAASLAIQLACYHSPAELAICSIGGQSSTDWLWLKWLPHVNSGYSPIQTGSLAGSAAAAIALVSQLEEILAERSLEKKGEDKTFSDLPAILVVVLDDAPIERSRLVQLAEHGPDRGIFVLWVAGDISRVPAGCRAFVEVGASGQTEVGLVHAGQTVVPVRCETASVDVARHVARRLAPVVDSGARLEDDSDLPKSVSFLAVVGTEVAKTHEPVIERWRASDPALFAAEPTPHRHALSLRGVVGQAGGEAFHLDLRTQGPHALVGGTTGAGKSEFLQTWVLGMALQHSPKRLTFLFVDYKGGSAFANCTQLPHCVGLVTDLRPHLVRRALTSLRAELRYRERILEHKGAKDLIDLEKSGDPDAPPSLIIIVDEFAALVQEVPEFIDGVVDVAQRGRSLGLHLVLATQQPSGVIKGNLRANTNMRVALRMADEADSDDVIGDRMAAGFDPSIPGRGAAKTGPGRLTAFQSLYVGGSTAEKPPRPSVSVESLVFGVGTPWVSPESEKDTSNEPEGPTDIARVVTQIRAANTAGQLPAPRLPWLETLADAYELALLEQRRDTELVLGVQDDPAQQLHHQVMFRPDDDGNMAIFGTGGSGKSTVLRSVALSAAVTPRSGPIDIYALDFGARGLAMLEDLPHVGAVINGDDHERVARLMRWLREEVESRSKKYAAVRASTITEYRTLGGEPDEPRIVVLVDGMAAFRQEYELGPRSAWFNVFGQLAADGRPVGIHMVVTADRPSTIPASIGATIQQRLVLRLADADDYAVTGVPNDVLGADSPPGRGIFNGLETQIAVLGGSANLAAQARAVDRLKAVLERRGRRPAKPIESLTERVPLTDLPIAVGGMPSIGVRDDLLKPIGISPAGTFLIVGPPASGRTTCMAALTLSVLRSFPDTKCYFFGNKRSQLASLARWADSALTDEDAVELAGRLEQEIKSGELAPTDNAPVVIVVDAVSNFFAGSVESPLEALVQAADSHDVLVLAESEISALGSSWGLGQALRARRRGLALQPDDLDGNAVFRTDFPRMSRSEFPPGRGILVDSGKIIRVQVALPE